MMKNKRSIFALLLLALLAAGCQQQPMPLVGPDPTAVAALVETVSPVSSLPQVVSPVPVLPDLVILNVYLGMQGVPAHGTECIQNYGPFEIRTMVQNLGGSSALNIVLAELATGTNLTIGELNPGQSMELVFPLASPNAAYNVVVDPQNTIVESNESNNSFSYLAITPTPPVLCTPALSSTDISTPVPSSELGSAALSQSLLLNSTYRSPDWGEYQLQDGIYYRTPPTELETAEVYTTRLQGPIFYGDINADGVEDALVIQSTQNGGTGHFVELAAVLNEYGNPRNVATVYLGDRVVVEAGRVENDAIVLNMRVQGPNDGLCCPSQFVTWNFVLHGDQLIKLP